MIGYNGRTRKQTHTEAGSALVRAATALGQGAVLFLLSRARLFGELSPLAAACFSSGVTCGWNAFAMLAGCAGSAAVSGFTPLDMTTLLSCSLIAAVHLTVRLMGKRPSEREADFLSGAAAGISMLVFGAAYSGGITYNLILAFLNAALAALVAPTLRSALSLSWKRRLLMPEEQLSLALMAALMTIGFRSAPWCGEVAGVSFAVWLTLLFSGAGCGLGAMAGLVAGAALGIGGSDPFAGYALGLCGALAGCAFHWNRAAGCAAFFLTSFLSVQTGIGYSVGRLDILPVAAGCAAHLLTPFQVIDRLHGWMKPARYRADPERMAERMRGKAGRKLNELGDVFGELADGYAGGERTPTERQLIAEARKRLCAGCEGYAACWQGGHSRAGRLFCRLTSGALTGRGVSCVRDLPPDLIRHCRRSVQIDKKLVPWLEELAKGRLREMRQNEARGLMARQFRQTQRIMEGLATQLSGGVCFGGEYARLARAALDRAGIRVKDVMAVLDDRLELICVLDGVWAEEKARQAARLLTDELGLPMSPVLRNGRVPGECELRIVQAPGLTAAIGEESLPAKNGAVSGDGHFAGILPDGRLLAVISDGMGSGEAAARESGKCISLLRKFVGAGIEREDALSAVNSLLVLRGGEEMFATADVCVVDLYTGAAEFSKLGACGSFILREKEIVRIPGGRLPMGILDQVEPAATKMEVHPGDMIILFSDGVADEMKAGQTEALEKELFRVRRMRPEEAAQRLIAFARERDGRKERDDMTVLAVRILARRVSR